MTKKTNSHTNSQIDFHNKQLAGLTLPATDSLEVRLTKNKGRGVFAKRAFSKGELVERSLVIPIPIHEEPQPGMVLYGYTFAWGDNGKQSAIVLGFGSIFNHSYQPNAMYVKQEAAGCIDFIALQSIKIGEEITINYNGAPDSKDPLWFTPID